MFQGSFEDGAFKQKTPHPTGLHSPQLHHCVLENDWTDTIRCPTTRFHISLIHGLSHPNICKAFVRRPKPNARRTIICHKLTWHQKSPGPTATLTNQKLQLQPNPWGFISYDSVKKAEGNHGKRMCRKEHAYMMLSWRGLGW